MKAVTSVNIVDGKCVVTYSDGSEQELYEYPPDENATGVTSVNGMTGNVVIPTATTSVDGLMSKTDKSNLYSVITQVSDLISDVGETPVKIEIVPPADILDFGQHEFVINNNKLVFGGRTWYYHWYVNCTNIDYIIAGFRVHSSSASVPHLVYTDDDLNVISALDAYAEGTYSDVKTTVPTGATRCYIQSQDSRAVNSVDSSNKTSKGIILSLGDAVNENITDISLLEDAIYTSKQYPYEGEKISLTPSLNYKEIASINRGYSQGAACYGKYLFQFHSQNSNYPGCTVFDLDTKKEIQFINLGSNANYHNNNASFGTEKYDSADPFPLLYASQESDAVHGCIVYRITETGNTNAPYAMTKVQTITGPSDFQYPQFIVDPDGYLWMCKTITNNGMQCLKFALPTLASGDITLDVSNKLDEITFTRIAHPQGAVIDNGIVYFSQGDSVSSCLQAVDLSDGTVLSTIRFAQCDLPYEPEGVFLYNWRLCITFSTGYTTGYMFNF